MTRGAATRTSKKRYPRPTKQGMAGRIQQQVAAIKDQHGANLVKGDDLYEAFVFTEVRRAIHRFSGVLPTLKLSTTGEFVIRRGPGHIHNRTFSWAEFNYLGHDYEMHIGVRASGLSQVAHEGDVSVIVADAAERARNDKTHPVWGSVRLSVECKYYAPGLPLNFGRSLLGSQVELPYASCILVSNSDAASITDLVDFYKLGPMWSPRWFGGRAQVRFAPLYTLRRSQARAAQLDDAVQNVLWK